jgi:hypothetical protein
MANVTITADGIVQVIKIGEVITGPQGNPGVDGKSAYQLALDGGFVGTQEQWIASLKGADGKTPVKGVDYFDGRDGAPGKDGKSLRYEDLTEQQKAELKGAKGEPGAPGKDGKPGTTDYNQLTNKPDLTLKADVSYVDTRYAMLHASKADKHYVDSQDTVLKKKIDTGLQDKVDRTGDTMTGNLNIVGNTADSLVLASATSTWQNLIMVARNSGGIQNSILFAGQNAANKEVRYGQLQTVLFGRTDGKESASVIVKTILNGTMTTCATLLGNELRLENSKLTFGASDVAMIAGNGMPNGKILAPVGSTYIDRDATNGAIRWIKKTGGNSVNGWAVDYGDTGWRNITPNPLPANIASTIIKVRRCGDVVEFCMDSSEFISVTETKMFDRLPEGFRIPSGVYINAGLGPGTSHSGRISLTRDQVKTQASVGKYKTTYVRYTTDDAWPATLPGTAA